MTIYYKPNFPQSPPFPAMLAVGDSWFWYPKVSNLLAEISAIVRPDYSNIMAYGYIGARLEEYVQGRYAADFYYEMKPQNAQYYSAVLISGGGNDVVDWNLCLKADCSQQTSPKDCIDSAQTAANMDSLAGWLFTMISTIHSAYDRNGLRRPAVIAHCYDYPLPDGRPFVDPVFHTRIVGPWLKPAMDARGVPADLDFRTKLMHALLDSMAEALSELHSPADNVWVVQSLGTLDVDEADWDNELHPTGRGFRKLVHGPWRALLEQAGLAA